MNHIWWRSHLRRLPELGGLGRFGSFQEADELMPFLTTSLAMPPGGKVLELGCGRGSFAVRFAQWGYAVTAVEESAPMLAVAEEAARQRGVRVEFRCAEPGSIPERSIFDGAVLLDFGAFSDADNAQMLRTIAAALKPGARCLFSLHNPYYWCRSPGVEHQVMQNVDVIRRYAFDFDTGAVVSRIRCITGQGERRDLPAARFRAYTLPELRALAAAVGLADLRIMGQDEAGMPLSDRPLDSLHTPFFHCLALRPVLGEAGEGI
jgi:SAM-dependent methyltransferase